MTPRSMMRWPLTAGSLIIDAIMSMAAATTSFVNAFPAASKGNGLSICFVRNLLHITRRVQFFPSTISGQVVGLLGVENRRDEHWGIFMVRIILYIVFYLNRDRDFAIIWLYFARAVYALGIEIVLAGDIDIENTLKHLEKK